MVHDNLMHSAGLLPSPKLPEISWQQHSAIPAATSEPVEPIYSTPTPTGKTPLTTGGSVVSDVSNADQGYSSINLVAAPSARKAKLKAVKAVRQPPVNCQARADMEQGEDSLYSTVSNAPKITSRSGTHKNFVSLFTTIMAQLKLL